MVYATQGLPITVSPDDPLIYGKFEKNRSMNDHETSLHYMRKKIMEFWSKREICS